jgi:two-component system invasion response regulator UvrY
MRAQDVKNVPAGARSRQATEVMTLVADDGESFREALRQLVAATPGFILVGEVSSGEDAIVAVDRLSPHFVLLDVRMPGIGGVEAARRIARWHPEIVVVLISVHGREELPPELVAGADAAAFVNKQSLRPRLLRELWEQHRDG